MAGLLDLPDEMLVNLLSRTGDDDFSMLQLPLVCSAFERACRVPAVSACRLASRVRQVAEALPPAGPTCCNLGAWLIGHTWGAILEAQKFFEAPGAEQRVAAFAATLRGVESLQVATMY